MDGQLVARGFEGFDRELVGAALDLLHCQGVDVLTLQEGQDAVDAGADGVDVPGGQAHGSRVAGV